MCSRGLSRYSLLLLLGVASWSTQVLAKDCVGVVAASTTPFWLQVEAGARLAAKERGVDMYFRGPSREGQVETQLQMINWVLRHGCKALVIAPGGPEIAPRVQQLAASGVITVYLDRDLPGSPVRGVVATDNFSAGVKAGQMLAAALGGQGNVALLRLRADVSSTSERERGFLQGAQEGGLNILVDSYIGSDSQAALLALHNQLGQLAGVFTPNSTSSRATLAALRRLGKSGELLHIGFDADQSLIAALRKGEIYSLLIQQAHSMGYQAVQLAVQGLHDQLPAQSVRVTLQVKQVTRDNLVQWLEAEAQELSAGP